MAVRNLKDTLLKSAPPYAVANTSLAARRKERNDKAAEVDNFSNFFFMLNPMGEFMPTEAILRPEIRSRFSGSLRDNVMLLAQERLAS